MRHPSFPNTMSGVIFQPGAFAEAGKLEKIAAESAKKAALDAISGIDPGFGSLYYYNPRSETNHKMYMRETVLDIGSYRFCL
ncbi:MAG: cell wall hydrolase [Oscillospiraceae bacterium]|nr:cell wall hydrolase [Oscillospiraceae bacterium]